jgi:hypothetical protein
MYGEKLMDLGEPFKREMRIKPGEDGSFVVMIVDATGYGGDPTDYGRSPAPFIGFTCIDDLLIWMAKHGTKSRVTELKEGDVVKTPSYERAAMDALDAKVASYAYQKSGMVAGGAALCGMDALNGLKRTTAAEIIREREAKAFTIGDVKYDNVPPTPAA